jgi:hypothetical protein
MPTARSPAANSRSPRRFLVFTEPLDARNLGLAEHGEELILAPRKVARVGRQKGLDFSCHLSANCSNAPLLDRNAHISIAAST